jgi:hypothetical protein
MDSAKIELESIPSLKYYREGTGHSESVDEG